MDLYPQDIWKKSLADLEVSMSGQHFHMWIEKAVLSEIRPVGDTHAIAIINAPTAMHAQMIEGRFYATLKETLDRVSGRKVDLQFKVTSAVPTENKPEELHTSSTSSPQIYSKPNTQDNSLFSTIPTIDSFKIALQKAKLRPDFTFENFAVSTTNEMAYAATQAVSRSPGTAYNPLFLYGGVGVGKTHLMQSVGQNILKNNPQTSLLYCAGEEFTNEIVAAIQTKKTIQFKERYRKINVLLIDDVQFIAGKQTVQEEFFHTFNAVTQSGGQVIITSDRPPHEITLLEDRLRSRFEAGLIIDIQQPTFELRTAIVLIKSEAKGIELPMDCAQQISSYVDNARKIEGVISQLHSLKTLMNKEINLELVKSILAKEETPSISRLSVKPREVIKTVAAHFKVTTSQLTGPRRSRPLVDYRHIAMFILYEDLKISLMQVGAEFGGKDHTSVIHAVNKIKRKLTDSPELQSNLAAIRASISGGK
ncbi:MAG: chromosomal replication initiator protein DnaA [Candidatus Woesebacteria bacterium]